MENDGDGREDLMEKIDKICSRDPNALSVIENIVEDLLCATEMEESAIQSLYMDIIKKGKALEHRYKQ